MLKNTVIVSRVFCHFLTDTDGSMSYSCTNVLAWYNLLFLQVKGDL